MSSTFRYFLYFRKSSESEERQELSIPAQQRECTALAARRGFTVLAPYLEEARSAKEPGRPVFTDLVDRVSRGDGEGIICWKLDRLARNPIDGGRIMYALGKGQIKEIVTPERTYTGTADDKLLMSIIFGMATKYSDDLSDNVKRGNREALERGRWPGKPKLGYVRDHATMRLVPDPDRFAAMQDLWRMLLAGSRPLDILDHARRHLGLRTPVTGKIGGKLLPKSALYRLFRDPFYTGFMPLRGTLYAGTHPAMVTAAEFEEVQAAIDGRTRPTTRAKHLTFTYRGLIRCGSCTAAVVARRTINRYGKDYTYYHCCRKERRYGFCPERAVQEHDLETAMAEWLGRLTPPETWLEGLGKGLERLAREGGIVASQGREQLDQRLSTIDAQLDRERQLLAREVILEADYTTDRNRLLVERQQITEQLSRAEHPDALVEPWRRALEELRSAQKRFVQGTPEERRAIVDAVTWNLKLHDRQLALEAKKPFAVIGEWSRFPTWSG